MVVLNLIQNAFPAMPDGGQLRVFASSADGWIEIAIHDTGIGIAPEKLSRIFDPFYSRRADGSKGTGLRLSIARTIVDNFGGTIEAESQVSEGSVLSICLRNANCMGEVAT